MRSLVRLFVVLIGLLGVTSGPVQAQSRVEDRVFSVTVFAHRVSWQSSDGWPSASVMPLIRDSPRGGYRSSNPAIIGAINKEMTANGIWPMVSWWGPGDNYGGDTYMNAFLSQPGPPLAVLYEVTGRLTSNFELHGTPNGKGGEYYDFNYQPNADTFVADMEYLHRTFFTGPHADRFVRVDGKPVLFIWLSHAFEGPFDKAMERVRARVPLYVVGSDFTVPIYTRPGIETVVPAMDAISSYGGYNWDQYGLQMTDRFPPAYRQAVRDWSAWMDRHAPRTQILQPMIFNYDERLIAGRNGYHFSSTPDIARQLATAVRAGIADPCATRVLPMTFIVSYDECYEGTCIIPSEEHGSSFQDVVRDVFKDPVVITAEQVRDCRADRDRTRW